MRKSRKYSTFSFGILKGKMSQKYFYLFTINVRI